VSELARGEKVTLRHIERADLEACAPFHYTLFITEPGTALPRLLEVHAESGFWTDFAGALAVDAEGRLVGTLQFYRSGPGMHGYEIGYILHSEADRGKGYASDALRAFSDFFFASRPDCHRLQLIIETWNDASTRLAEACGYVREGILRKAGYSNDTDPPDVFVYARIR
jgi:RimJ/RimL family protein N-acetyltransferase